MNLILHQIKTDLRHFRWWLAALWISSGVEICLLVTDGLAGEARAFLQGLLVVWQVFNGVLLIAALVQADALVGTGAAWLTRPIRRRHLFWAKTIFLLGLLLLPRCVALSLGCFLRGYSVHLWLCSVGQSLMFGLALVSLAAALAALTRDLARFFLAVGIGVGGMFAWLLLLEVLKKFHVINEDGSNRGDASFNASALTAAYLALIAGSLVAWIAQAGLRQWRIGVICVALGLMAFPWIDISWRWNFLRPSLTPSAPVTLSVATENSPTNSASYQRLAADLILTGVPAGQLATLQGGQASLKLDSETIRRGGRQLWAPLIQYRNGSRLQPTSSGQRDDYFRLIEKTFQPCLYSTCELHRNDEDDA